MKFKVTNSIGMAYTTAVGQIIDVGNLVAEHGSHLRAMVRSIVQATFDSEMNMAEVSMRKVKSFTPGSRSHSRDLGGDTAPSPDTVETLAPLPAKTCSRTDGIGGASRVTFAAMESELAHPTCHTEAHK